jgi:hypothetical protein
MSTSPLVGCLEILLENLRLEFLFLKIVLRNQGLFLSSFASGKGKGIQNTNCCNEKRFDYFCL